MKIYIATDDLGQTMGFFGSYKEAKQEADAHDDGDVTVYEYPCTKEGMLRAMSFAQGME